MNPILMSLLVAASLVAAPVLAQQAPASSQVISSEPGKASMTNVVKVSAMVAGIDKATRTVTLKRHNGQSIDIVCGDEVKNFDQIKLKDEVVVAYIENLTLELKKTKAPLTRVDKTDAVRAAPGQQPGAAAGRQVTVLADVIDVNPTKKTITLKGPKGNTLTLDVQNPDQFKVVKKGDQVEANYIEAMAISVEPAKK